MYRSKIKSDSLERFLKAVLCLDNIDEAYRFFEDVCTVSELQAISQRLDVAKMLEEGRTYAAIAEDTGASTATISRVNRALTYGADGYRLVFDKSSSENTKKTPNQ